MMKSKLSSLLAASVVTGILAAATASAAVVVATENQLAPPATPTFTPTYVIPSANNVLAGLLPSASVGDFTIERSGGLPVLTNGVFGELNNDGGPTATHANLATFGDGGGSGSTLTYTLATATVLSSIHIYGGWNDRGRDQQSYTIQLSTNGGSSYFDLTPVNYNPDIPAGQESANHVGITDNAGNLAGGQAITNIRINANATENGYAGLAEITAYAAVPEASTTALLGACGALALLRRRRNA